MSYGTPHYPNQVGRTSAVMLLATAFMAGLTVWYLINRFGQAGAPVAESRIVTARGDLAEDEKATIELFRKASPSVVHITTLRERANRFNMAVAQIPQGTGSGFIWDKQGHIVTNFHVIQNADAAKVTLADHSSWNAKLVGAYPDKDLAVLRIDAPTSKLHPIPIGTSHDLQVGQKTFAIGNPFGLDQTLTTGIVSALGREIESVTRRPIQDAIQTDAAINPGNSGGPLLDSAGRLIGVNTAIFSPSGASSGIGFAIPVDEVNRVVPQLIATGKVVRPMLGVNLATDQLARNLGIEGAIIGAVEPGSPAHKAGLRPIQADDSDRPYLGDVIVAINGKPVRRANDVFLHLEKLPLGTTVTVTVLREQKQVDVAVTLEAYRDR
jgi:S1-C subfamily serine protease